MKIFTAVPTLISLLVATALSAPSYAGGGSSEGSSDPSAPVPLHKDTSYNPLKSIKKFWTGQTHAQAMGMDHNPKSAELYGLWKKQSQKENPTNRAEARADLDKRIGFYKSTGHYGRHKQEYDQRFGRGPSPTFDEEDEQDFEQEEEEDFDAEDDDDLE